MKLLMKNFKLNTMNFKKTQNLTATAILAVALALTSCQKENVTPKETFNANTGAALADAAYSEVNMATDMGDDAFKNEGCAVVTIDMVAMPHVMTIDYGMGCVGRDARNRQGQVIVTFDQANLDVPGVNIHTSFNNYFVNGRQYTGSVDRHHDGLNANHNPSYTVTANVTVYEPGGASSNSVFSQQTQEIVAGSSTQTKSDDVSSFTGTASGTDINGNSFGETITSSLIKKRQPGCSFFYVQGVVVNQTVGQPVKTTDYGTGGCDNLADVTINGNTQTITLQ